MMKILSLGAGVQSTAVALLSALGEQGIDRIDHAVFADTGWEPRAVYKHLEWLTTELERCGIPVHVVSCGRSIREDTVKAQTSAEKSGRYASMPTYTLSKDGSVGQVRRQCTSEYKIKPIEKKVRELAGVGNRRRFPGGPVVEQWFGISLDEIRRMRISKHRWSVYYYPLVDIGWDRDRCQSWLRSRGIDAPRSACVGCPYKSNLEWRSMKNNAKSDFDDAVFVDGIIRKSHGMLAQKYLHRDCVPLDEVDLSTPEDHGQVNMFREECAGMCGV